MTPELNPARERMLVALIGVPVLIALLIVFSGPSWFVLPQGWGAERLRLGAGCAAAVALTLVLAVLNVSTYRLFSRVDMAGAAYGEPSQAMRVRLALLQNTLEQVVLAAIAYLAFAASVTNDLLPILPLCVAAFWIGRVCFVLGYRYGPKGRAFGFALTFAPTLVLYVMLVARLLGWR